MMKTQILLALTGIVFLLTNCYAPASKLPNEHLKTEAMNLFNTMLTLVQNDSVDAFKNLISKDATLFVEGNQLASKDVKAYLVEIYKTIGSKDAEIQTNVFYSLGGKSVYQESEIAFLPKDTTRGLILAAPPISVNYHKKTKESFSQNFKYEAGVSNYYVSDSAIARSMSPYDRYPSPIKKLAFTVVYIKVTGQLQLKHGHLSVAYKPDKVYLMKVKEPLIK